MLHRQLSFSFLCSGLFLTCVYVAGCSTDSSSSQPELTLEEKITQIGNAATDQLRYEGLAALQNDIQDDPVLVAEW